MDNSMPYALLVEDNRAHALLFERCLRRVPNSPSLRHIHDGRSALDFLAAKSLQRDLPSLVILDLKLPVLDGFDVLHLIRSVPDLCSLPVIILSTSHSLVQPLLLHRLTGLPLPERLNLQILWRLG